MRRHSERFVRPCPGPIEVRPPSERPAAVGQRAPPPSSCRRSGLSVLRLLRVVGLRGPLLELGLAHAGLRLLALALALELGAHEPALLLGLGWHARPPSIRRPRATPSRLNVGGPAFRSPRRRRSAPTMR